MKKKRLTALGAYIFAGGFTLGVRKHFEVLTHFEEGSFGVTTVLKNKLVPQVFTNPETWPTVDYQGVDFIFANPPCAPWSSCSAGRQMPWRLDPRVGCVHRVFKLIDKLAPKVWALESVRPLFTKGRELCDDLAREAQKRGYHTTVLYVEGSRHGVAQHRPRLFLVLSKVQLTWEPTKKTAATVAEVLGSTKFTTATKRPLHKRYDVLIRNTKPGERTAKVFNRLYPKRVAKHLAEKTKVVGRPSFQLQRLPPDGFCSVLTGDGRKIHHVEDRLITIEESAVLSGFPLSYQFHGTVGNRSNQIAKGVMPPVAEYLARQVRKGLEVGTPIKAPGYHFVEIFQDRVEEHAI